jgi:Na+:H+ antiporter, NhaA family
VEPERDPHVRGYVRGCGADAGHVIRTGVRVISVFRRFAKLEAASGILLMVCAVTALSWANSPWGGSYAALWETKLTLGFAPLQLDKSLLHWINDGLMALFFLVVGLEIKRELLAGELASIKRASLPIMAAIGGGVVPALIYSTINLGGPGANGWGIPMATDIAFSIGVLALLGRRVPPALKILLAALAIVDDLGAILVIALFYTAEVSWWSLGLAGFFGLLLFLVNRRGVTQPWPYLLLGFGLWVAMLKSGVHATIAGVLLAVAIPSGVAKASARPNAAPAGGTTLSVREKPLLNRMEHALHPWVAFAIMPLFALANAGLVFDRDVLATISQPVSLGILLGLILGKPVGIGLLSWLAVRSGLAVLPPGISWRHLIGVGLLAGIGFTMSLFIASLAFTDGPEIATAKMAILIASAVSGVGGYLLLLTAGSRRKSLTS